MKEATSELGGAVVVVSSVAILIAFFYITIWPAFKNNFNAQTACEKAVCGKIVGSDGMVSCTYNGDTFRCPFKG